MHGHVRGARHRAHLADQVSKTALPHLACAHDRGAQRRPLELGIGFEDLPSVLLRRQDGDGPVHELFCPL
jgi:hypothetical protein